MSDRLLSDLARGFDAIFGATRICRQCGMTAPADPMKHYHDNDGHRTAEASRIASDLQREAKDAADEARGRIV